MTKNQFLGAVARLWEAGDAAGILALADRHLRSLVPEFTDAEAARLDSLLEAASNIETARQSSVKDEGARRVPATG